MNEAIVEGLAQVWASTRALLAELDDDDWARPTPCDDWSVRELVAHIAAGQSGFEDGFDQPELPAGWASDKTSPVDVATAAHVAARADWTREDVVDELVRATDAQVARLRGLDAEGWSKPERWPPGDPTVRGWARNRLLDSYIHLLDLRTAVGRKLDPDDEPAAFQDALAQAFDFAGWGAVKRAGITEDTRIRLDLHGPGARTADLVIEGRRGRLDPAAGDDPADMVRGSTMAFLFVATARRDWIEGVGGLEVHGPAARSFVDGYVIWL